MQPFCGTTGLFWSKDGFKINLVDCAFDLEVDKYQLHLPSRIVCLSHVWLTIVSSVASSNAMCGPAGQSVKPANLSATGLLLT